MIVFHNLRRTTRLSRVHKTESVLVMGYARSTAVRSTGWSRNSETSLSISSFSGHICLLGLNEWMNERLKK